MTPVSPAPLPRQEAQITVTRTDLAWLEHALEHIRATDRASGGNALKLALGRIIYRAQRALERP